MDDLYLIFRKKLAVGESAIHPHRWLLREARGSLSIGFMDYTFAKNLALWRAEPAPSGPPLCIDGTEVTEVCEARVALKKCERQSRADVYLAHSLVSQCYARDLPTGVEVQNAIKDCLKEVLPSLKFEVSTPVGQVDCVTDDAIYEVAKLNSWKHALGQLCAYKLHLRRRKTINQYGIVVNYKRCSIPDSRFQSRAIRHADDPQKSEVRMP
jgi:hypothetical protein